MCDECVDVRYNTHDTCAHTDIHTHTITVLPQVVPAGTINLCLSSCGY